MLRTLLTLISTLSLSTCDTNDYSCDLIASQYFQWIAEDGSLTNLHFISDNLFIPKEPSDNCDRPWQPLGDSKSCRFCKSSSVLECEGSEVYSIPSVASLPTRNFSLFKLSGPGLTSLPSHSFSGLDIGHLVIEYSNLSHLAADTFKGVASVKYIRVERNTLDYLGDADHLFGGIKDLSVVELRSNGLKVLSSGNSANLMNLTVFSLADNPIYTLDVKFLQNSNLELLDLRNVLFKVTPKEFTSSGLSSLPNSLKAVDLNGAKVDIAAIEKILEALSTKNITILNLANLECERNNMFVPLLHLRKSLKYLNLQGTQLSKSIFLGKKDINLFTTMSFDSLEQVNMKNCGIEQIGNVIQLFPNLAVLSLSENPLLTLNLDIFSHLPKLSYFDYTGNKILNISKCSDSVAEHLQVFDLSHSEIDLELNDLNTVFSFMPNLQNLSLCEAKLTNKNVKALQSLTNLTFLDLSGTVPSCPDVHPILNYLLMSSNLTLKELHYSRNYIDLFAANTSIFLTMHSLRVLNLSTNFIRSLTPHVFGSSLETLVLKQNFITTWYSSIFKLQAQIKKLDLSKNQLTYITDAMFEDFSSLTLLNLNENPITCDERVISAVCDTIESQNSSDLPNSTWLQNNCYDPVSDSYRNFQEPKDCHQYFLEVSENIEKGSSTITPRVTGSSSSLSFTWLYIIVGTLILAVAVGLTVYRKWWTIKCYVYRQFTLRKARILRKSEEVLSRSDIQYDVFVSYSDNDRSWVLDHLVPHLEADGDVSLCFHERDFQVGLSILENIIECMDRSHCLLLIVSSAFVRSKWCQFEMHLAQYRLIETLRDQLVLILLEDIPRKSRPQTLHHMMMTKTYLIWPHESCKEDARELFWKRLKRALKPSHSYIFDA